MTNCKQSLKSPSAAEEHILISLEARHAENILSGQKQVELRRRAMNVSPGTTVWIYVKQPIGSVIGKAKVSAVHALAPNTLWKRFGSVSGLTRSEFFSYFDGVAKGTAISLEDAERLDTSVSLDTLREFSDTFQPPQFFLRIGTEHPLHEAIAATA